MAQIGAWDAARLHRLPAAARSTQPVPAASAAMRSPISSGGTWPRVGRVIVALYANTLRRPGAAQYCKTSGKALCQKMRKYQIFDEEPETRETE
ncbi:hypothetical protein J8I87_04890 [Paraburkholderia sp. LEh10]|uniref:hypothetical protein n=1 Tax=Paraburkholderia sp. LEh10 TaxID=2821353 RepID=UPI001AEA7572|nr:hypothetical protein [Paraburkholderia sp. LEh10]MBP0589066.1 hypothetical protein [Paraburkholderia sp. LEh10]